MKLLLATGNVGKVKEFKAIFDSYNLTDLELISLKDLPEVAEAPEDGETFLANAYQKVMYYYDKFKMPCLADDTGLLVEALNGAPGVHSARYGSINGEHTDPTKNCERILRELNGVTNRKAEFHTAIYYYDGTNLISSVGLFKGEIGYERKGTEGFGYDPIFYLPEYHKTTAELGVEFKNSISHRFKSTNLMIKELQNYGILKK